MAEESKGKEGFESKKEGVSKLEEGKGHTEMHQHVHHHHHEHHEEHHHAAREPEEKGSEKKETDTGGEKKSVKPSMGERMYDKKPKKAGFKLEHGEA